MATSDRRQTLAERRADEDWVFLHHDGDGVGQRDVDAKRKEESPCSAAERPKSAQATKTGDDSVARFFVGFPHFPGLYAFPGVCEASLVDDNPVRLLWACLKRLTRIFLRAAVLSCAARFLFWSAAKASVVKRPEMLQLLLLLAVMNLGAPLANLATWNSEFQVNLWEMLYYSTRQRHNLMRYKAFRSTVRILTYIGSFLLCFPMARICIDVGATWRILLLHVRDVYTTEFDGIGEIIREYLV
ncbi:uncharacterized protein [Dermacentor andersoni]|uniref:uncharacterized protein n=1 Tax=Dermacentor andersoni TaxID=34620 RepID=UPI002416D0F3|nr:uncharacterized protein LOC129385284 [Dermacentor andersoni]